ncbi:MAG TPA: peptidase C39 family protein [Herpetosiphonaceae bacterium]|nr:peptidase C39 family protein [Herpetosiphonaceae bacterium]
MLGRRVALGLLLSVMVSVFGLAPAQAASSTYTTGFTRWRAAEGSFAGWSKAGVALGTGGVLTLDPATAAVGSDPYAAGAFNGGNFYNGGSFLVGEATGLREEPTSGFTEAIASWNAETPEGTWIETLIRAEIAGRWTKWYNLGVWASETGTVQRHYVNAQGDADGFVAVDTLVLNGKKAPPATAFQLKVRLFQDRDRVANSSVVPTVHAMSVATSTTAVKPSTLVPGNPALWNRYLEVPECSQMVYPDGGEVWCSPTSTSMVLGYWQNATGACEPRVRAAVNGVYDWLYDGHGNWPFNTAYVAEQGFEAYVARFTSMAQAERWIAKGVPVVISFAWKKSSLEGAAIPSSNGHLAVLVGFDAEGNPIVNDPAAASDADVQRTYNRAELESLWLEHSGGTVYLIYPQEHVVPDEVL